MMMLKNCDCFHDKIIGLNMELTLNSQVKPIRIPIIKKNSFVCTHRILDYLNNNKIQLNIIKLYLYFIYKI